VFLGSPQNTDCSDPFYLLLKELYWPELLDTYCGLNKEHRGALRDVDNPPVP
jgi:hypothetical protein